MAAASLKTRNSRIGSNPLKQKPVVFVAPDLTYEKQIDQLFLWIKAWNETQHSETIETCLKHCTHSQLRMLWTILEPLMHRDFIYHNFDIKPDSTFSSLSTYVTRELYPRLEKTVNKNYKKGRRDLGIHRISSSHIVNAEDARCWANSSVLPGLKSASSAMATSATASSVTTSSVTVTSPIHEQAPATTRPSSGGSESSQSSSLIDSPRRFSGQRPTFFSTKDGTMKSRITKPHAIASRGHQQRASSASDTSSSCGSSTGAAAGVFDEFPIGQQTVRRHIQDEEKEKFAGREADDANISSHERAHRKMIKSGSLPSLEPVKLIKGPLCAEVKDDAFKQQLWCLSHWFVKWTGWQQEQFLRRYLKLLQKVHLFLMYALIMVRLYCDFISLLPEDLSLNILSYFKPKQLKILAKVCIEWDERSSHNLLWSKICTKKSIERVSTISYKDTYLNYKETKLNWLDGRFSIKELKGHTGSVTAVRFLGNIIASGSADKTIRIWDMTTKKCLQVLEGHQKTVWGLRFLSKSLLVSCSGDSSARIWNLRNGECTRTIIGHEGAVWCIHIKGNYLITGAADKTARLWNLRNSQLISTFGGHPGSVFSVEMSDDRQTLYTGSIEGTVRVWDVENCGCRASFQVGNQKEDPVNGLCYSQGFLLCCCLTTLQLWDVDRMEQMKTREASTEKIETIQLEVLHKKKGLRGKYLSAGKDGKIKLWTFVNKKMVQSFQVHDDAVNSIQYSDSIIVSGSQDTTVKILDFYDAPTVELPPPRPQSLSR